MDAGMDGQIKQGIDVYYTERWMDEKTDGWTNRETNGQMGRQEDG